MSFYIPTTKSVLDKSGFMDRPNGDESGQNPTQGFFDKPDQIDPSNFSSTRGSMSFRH